LFTGKEEHRKMNVIRSREHELFTETINKIALSANDDKRIIQPGKISLWLSSMRGLGRTGTHLGAYWGHEGNWQRGKGFRLNGPKV